MNVMKLLTIVICCGLLASDAIQYTGATVPDDVVWMLPTATFWLGETHALLTCQFRGTPFAVEWMKGHTVDSAEIVATLYNSNVKGPGIDNGTFNIDDTFSLIFTQPKESDSGKYICRVLNHHGNLIDNSTDLRVLDPKDNTVYTVPKKTAWKDETVTLPCNFSIAPSRVIWYKGDSPTMQALMNYSDGIYNVLTSDSRYGLSENFDLIIRGVDALNDGIYTCEVMNVDSSPLRNSTILTTYVQPDQSSPDVQQCHSSIEDDRCHYTLNKEPGDVQLDCAVYGAKPAVSVVWTKGSLSGTSLNGTSSVTKKHNNGTFVTISTLKRRKSEIKFGDNFTCVASGMALRITNSSLSSFEKVAIIDKVASSSPNKGAISGGVFAVFIIVTVGLLLFLGIYRTKYKEVSHVKLPSEDVEMARAVDQLSLKELRKFLNHYKPGKLELINTPPDRINIGLFGIMAGGKSSTINSINFALTGHNEKKAKVHDDAAGGSHTMYREPILLTDCISMYDNRGVKDYSEEGVAEFIEQIRGKRNQKNQQISEGEKMHCPVVVCHTGSVPKDVLSNFITKFTEAVSPIWGRHVMLVVTHKDEVIQEKLNEMHNASDEENEDTEPEKENLTPVDENTAKIEEDNNAKVLKIYKDQLNALTGIPKDQIWFFENYTEGNDDEDEEKKKEFLRFVVTCLKTAERNINFGIKDEEEKNVDPLVSGNNV